MSRTKQKKEARKIVEEYASKLRADNYPFSAVYLFGSMAKEQAHKDSDIDVAIISSQDIDENWEQNEFKLWQLSRIIDNRIQPLEFSEEDFKDLDDPMVYEIRKTGIKVA